MRKVMVALTGAVAALALMGGGAWVAGAHAAAPVQGDAADRAEIENLMAYYIYAMDWEDPDAYASVFTPDGVLTWANGDVKGREAIRAFIQAQRDPPKTGVPHMPGGNARHFVTNHFLVIKGNKAVSRAYWEQLDANGPNNHAEVGAYGHYEDDLVKVNGHWLFTHRQIFNEQLARRKAGPVNPTAAMF